MKVSIWLLSLVTVAALGSLLPNAGATGRTVGNGGDVVVCENALGTLQSIELLDFYEGRILKGIVTELGDPQWSIERKIAYALTRLQRVSPARARRYAAHAARFFEEALFLEDAHLEDIKDSGQIVIPKECRIAQIANQSTPLYPDDKRYVLDRSLWDSMNNDGRAGLILHEVIYREALEWGHENSISVRLLNANLSSAKIESMTVQTYTKFLQDLGFFSNEIQGAVISLDPTPPVFYTNGNLKRGQVLAGSEFIWNSQRISIRDHISFFESGILKEVVLNSSQQLLIDGEQRTLAPYELTFYETGALESATFETPSLFRTSIYDLTVTGAAHFHDNGSVALANTQSGWVDFNGQRAKPMSVLQLDRSGGWLEGYLNAPISLTVGGQKVLVHEHLKLDAFRKPMLITLAEESILRVANTSARFSVSWKISFHEGTEKIRAACLAEDARFSDVSGRKKLFPARTVLKFDADGIVVANEHGC